MRWRLGVLAAVAVICAIGFVISTYVAADLSYRGSQIYIDLKNRAPTEAQQDLANRLYQQATALQLLTTPLAIGSAICVLAILVVLARRWQLREQ